MQDRQNVDPLAKFRRKPPQEPAPVPERQASPYVAFGIAATEKRYLVVRRKFPEPSLAFSYGQVTDLNADERYRSGVAVGFSTQRLIDIKGRNLEDLFGLLKEWRVEFLCEFDPEEWAEPDDPKQPVITNIEILLEPSTDPPARNKQH